MTKTRWLGAAALLACLGCSPSPALNAPEAVVLATPPCEESGNAPLPASATVTIVGDMLQVALDADTLGFNRTWAISLSFDTQPGGWWPAPTSCPPMTTERPDWHLTMTSFNAFPDCPCPTWFFSPSHVDTTTAWPLKVPTIQTVTPDTNLVLTFDLAATVACCPPIKGDVPLAPGQFYLLTVYQLLGPYGTEQRAAWRLMGYVQ